MIMQVIIDKVMTHQSTTPLNVLAIVYSTLDFNDDNGTLTIGVDAFGKVASKGKDALKIIPKILKLIQECIFK